MHLDEYNSIARAYKNATFRYNIGIATIFGCGTPAVQKTFQRKCAISTSIVARAKIRPKSIKHDPRRKTLRRYEGGCNCLRYFARGTGGTDTLLGFVSAPTPILRKNISRRRFGFQRISIVTHLTVATKTRRGYVTYARIITPRRSREVRYLSRIARYSHLPMEKHATHELMKNLFRNPRATLTFSVDKIRLRGA